jgi:hypothetical protein
MRHVRKIIVLPLILFIVLLTAPLQAKPPALPAMPSSTVINQVITQSGGPTYTPLGVPANVMTSLEQFGGVFEGVEDRVSQHDAASYIATGGILKETILPLVDSGSQRLGAELITPGSKPRQGQIVGALYQPYRGTMILVVTFDNKFKPDKIRMYYSDDQYHEYALKADKFKDKTEDSYDEGSIIAHKLSCVTVGKKQVCWEPADENAVREKPYPKDRIEEAYKRAQKAYDLGVDFFISDAVPDLIGSEKRTNCASAFNSTLLPLPFTEHTLTPCDPNLYVSAAKTVVNEQPIAIWVVDTQADLKGFTYNGTYLGYVPAGEYLVINATPEANDPGELGVLMLVNINDYNNHYLIPSIRMQQFADKKEAKAQVASIKDGATWYYGW